MAVIYPCKDCEERHIGRHSECEKYKDCTNKTRQISLQRLEEHRNYDDVFKAMDRMKKKRRLK